MIIEKELKEEIEELHLVCKNCKTDYELSPLIKAIKKQRNAEVKKVINKLPIHREAKLWNPLRIFTEVIIIKKKELLKELGLEDER